MQGNILLLEGVKMLVLAAPGAAGMAGWMPGCSYERLSRLVCNAAQTQASLPSVAARILPAPYKPRSARCDADSAEQAATGTPRSPHRHCCPNTCAGGRETARVAPAPEPASPPPEHTAILLNNSTTGPNELQAGVTVQNLHQVPSSQRWGGPRVQISSQHNLRAGCRSLNPPRFPGHGSSAAAGGPRAAPPALTPLHSHPQEH